MALSLTGITSGASPISAAHISQFFNLLTGSMTDQPVTLKNTLRVGGNQATSDNALTLVGVSSQTGYMIRTLLATGDTQPSFAIDKNGKLAWGAGGVSATDTTLERVSAGVVKVSSLLQFPEQATPSAPGASLGLMYFKSDGHPYYRFGAAGAETRFDSSGANLTDPLIAQIFS